MLPSTNSTKGVSFVPCSFIGSQSTYAVGLANGSHDRLVAVIPNQQSNNQSWHGFRFTPAFSKGIGVPQILDLGCTSVLSTLVEVLIRCLVEALWICSSGGSRWITHVSRYIGNTACSLPNEMKNLGG